MPSHLLCSKTRKRTNFDRTPPAFLSPPPMDHPIPGMESVVATVSGYHGCDRFNLIKLISHAGASYVGTMSRSITHLVCWKFEGRKYELAKDFDTTIIVNHRWVEDCVKEGKRIPEHQYMLKCGEEVGPLLMQVPVIVEKVVPTKKKCKELTPKSNIHEHSGVHSFLDNTSSRFLSREERNIRGHEESRNLSNMCPMREKRKIFNDMGNTSLPRSSHKGRRLVKKNIGRKDLESMLFDSDQECYPIGLPNKKVNTAIPSKCTDGKTDATIFKTQVVSDAGLNNEAPRGKSLDDIEVRKSNHLSTPKDSKSCPEDGLTSLESLDVESLNGKIKDLGRFEPATRLSASVELSCVICWTEFSSTRGVLPCGHRFCFSCIQDWADHMASRRKIATCPLCKASFERISKVEDAATSDQKIYSQTIPCASSTTDIFICSDQERCRFDAEYSLPSVCTECRCREPEELLISCHLCQVRCIHSYCLDPPLSPWTCIPCKDLQRLYSHTL